MTDLQKYKNIASTVTAAAVFVYTLVRPSAVTAEASKSLAFCLAVIIPSLFVNMALAAYLFPRMVNAMKGRHTAVVSLVCGILCGFPVGADIAVRLRKNGAGQNYADYINSFANNAGISFVISFAGISALKSIKAGVTLVVLEVLSALICAFVMKSVLHPDTECALPRQNEISFADALRGAVKSMAAVCGSIIAFACFSSIITVFASEGSVAYTLIKGFLEFSGGIAEAAYLPVYIDFICTAVFIGWSGFCVMMQVQTVGAGKLRIKYYLLSKLLQALLMGGMAAIAVKLIY